MNDLPEYQRFADNFLHPDEHNRTDLLQSITTMLDALTPLEDPVEPLAPYAGNPEHDYSFLEDFEALPDKPEGPEKIRRASARILSGSVRRHSPSAMQNIISPPTIDSVAIATVANLYKSSMGWDFTSAGVQEAERQIVRQLSKLYGWTADSDGVFTYGGKGCLTYAVRAGLNRCIPEFAAKGFSKSPTMPVVVTSEENHLTIESICSLLGLGTKACIRMPTDADQTVNLQALETKLRELLDKHIPIACVIASGGNTNNLNVDPIRAMRAMLDRLVEEYGLPYSPFLYADTVVGWAWLMYKDYDFIGNPLTVEPSVLQRLRLAMESVSDAHYADAAGVDFHKIGFTAYSASTFLMRDKSELHSLFTDEQVTHEWQPFGKNYPHAYTIEFSRSTAPIVAAWTVLQSLGKRGFQSYLAQVITMSDVFRQSLPQYGIEWVNTESMNHMSVLYPIPPNGPASYDELLRASPDEIAAAKHYAYNFFQYLADSTHGSSLAVRFILHYADSIDGHPCSMICLCPASPHTDTRTARELVRLIGSKKHSFDAEEANWKASAIPYAIHK